MTSAGRPAEGVEGPRIAREAALAVAAGEQVVARPLEHRGVHVGDAGHVAELQQAVGRQRLVRRGRGRTTRSPRRLLRFRHSKAVSLA